MYPRNLNISVACACLGASLSFPALAEGPMNTDDAGTLAKGGMKIEAVLGHDDEERSGELAVGFGPVENVEVALAFTRATDSSSDPSTRMNGTGIGIKWVPVQNETGWSFGASFGYGNTKVDERATPVEFTEKEYGLVGLATLRMDNGQVLHMNLGTTSVDAQGVSDNSLGWNIGYEFPLTDRLQLTVETFGVEHSAPDKAIGLRYEISQGLKAYAALGNGNDRSFNTLGFAWEF